VYNPAEAKERLPQSPYRRLELIPEAARDIIKVWKSFSQHRSIEFLVYLGKIFTSTTRKEENRFIRSQTICREKFSRNSSTG
jgi:hypothetical protein